MKLVQLLFVFTVLHMSVAREEPRYRIYNGFDANPKESAYVAKVQTIQYIFPNYQLLAGRSTGPTMLCTGSLISNQHVLTAKHCFEQTESVNVYLGSTSPDEQGMEISCSRCWALHHSEDLAVIRFSKKIQFSNNIQAVRLPTRLNHELFDLTGKSALIHGWGLTGSGSVAETLQSREITLPSPVPLCDNEKLICVPIENEPITMQGDSGGPMVIDGTIVGVLMGQMNLSLEINRFVLEAIQTDAFSKVTYSLDWISGVTGIKH